MRTIHVEYEYSVYQYEELSEGAKEVAKEWYLGGQDTETFAECLNETLYYLFPNGNLNVEFSLNCCQGDGLNIYGEVTVSDILQFLYGERSEDITDKLRIRLSEKDVKTIKHYNDFSSDLTINLPRNRYGCCCISNQIRFAEEWIEELEYNCFNNIKRETILKFESVVREIFTMLCKDYETWGYKYFYEISDEDMAEICEANGYEFLESGNVA